MMTADDETTTGMGACLLVYAGGKCELLGGGGGVALVTGLAVGEAGVGAVGGVVASGKRRYAGCPLGGATLNKT